MSTNELEVQPVEAVEVGRAAVKPLPPKANPMQEEYTQDPLNHEPPKTKSGVRNAETVALVRIACSTCKCPTNV